MQIFLKEGIQRAAEKKRKNRGRGETQEAKEQMPSAAAKPQRKYMKSEIPQGENVTFRSHRNLEGTLSATHAVSSPALVGKRSWSYNCGRGPMCVNIIIPILTSQRTVHSRTCL